jgi:hypothetical protein
MDPSELLEYLCRYISTLQNEIRKPHLYKDVGRLAARHSPFAVYHDKGHARDAFGARLIAHVIYLVLQLVALEESDSLLCK